VRNPEKRHSTTPPAPVEAEEAAETSEAGESAAEPEA
jgi:hypothetical protein